jgi:hypothetical protein
MRVPIAKESRWLSPFHRAASQQAKPFPKQEASKTMSATNQSQREFNNPICVFNPE